MDKTERSYEDRACEVSQRSGEHRQTKEPEAETNVTLKTEAKRKFQRGMNAGERAKRLQTMHEVLLDSVSATPRTRSVSAERIKQKWTTLTSNPLHTHSEKKRNLFPCFP